jgi:ribosomal protein L18E
MKVIIYIALFLFTVVGNQTMASKAIVKTYPDHLFKDEEPKNIQVNVLITDDREVKDTITTDIKEQIKNQLKSAFPKAKFVFAEKINQLKRSGDHINIMISIKEAGTATNEIKITALTNYYVTIYDVSRTPIYIKDGHVQYDIPNVNPEETETATLKSIDVANQRLVAFLQRNIKHKSFKPADQAMK